MIASVFFFIIIIIIVELHSSLYILLFFSFAPPKGGYNVRMLLILKIMVWFLTLLSSLVFFFNFFLRSRSAHDAIFSAFVQIFHLGIDDSWSHGSFCVARRPGTPRLDYVSVSYYTTGSITTTTTTTTTTSTSTSTSTISTLLETLIFFEAAYLELLIWGFTLWRSGFIADPW